MAAEPATRDHRAESVPGSEGQVVIICGVSGSGKTTVGKALAQRLHWDFLEGDDFHPAENIAKMQRGEPLQDADRKPWLYRLRAELSAHLARGNRVILACSALKASYRNMLCINPGRVHFVFLTGHRLLLSQRLLQRSDHFMPVDLLQSQLDALELPDNEFILNIDQPVAKIVDSIIHRFGFMKEPSRS
jgi:carbohydrate kinase (thermoresistant glucokinase family)